MEYECPDLVAELQKYVEEFKLSEEHQKANPPSDLPPTPEGSERLLRAIFDRRHGLDPKDQEWLDDLYMGYVEPSREERREALAAKSIDELLAERHEVVHDIIYFAMVANDTDAHKVLGDCVRHLGVIDELLRDR